MVSLVPKDILQAAKIPVVLIQRGLDNNSRRVARRHPSDTPGPTMTQQQGVVALGPDSRVSQGVPDTPEKAR
eukprot:1925723-Pyramimonas_sp.AAC.1